MERNELNRIWEAQEKELSEVKDVVDFLNDEVLEIKRDQYLSEGKWVTKGYTFVTGTGGPHVEFTSNYLICVYWGGDQMEFTTDDRQARNTIDQLEELMTEINP